MWLTFTEACQTCWLVWYSAIVRGAAHEKKISNKKEFMLKSRGLKEKEKNNIPSNLSWLVDCSFVFLFSD